jgi:acid stress chaperone HdeB
MKTLMMATLAAGILLANPAQAGKRSMDNIDFGTISCREFIEDIATASEDDAAAVMLWIDGYLSGVSGDTVLNWRGFETYSERLVEFCAKNRKTKLLDAARRVGID